MIFISAVLAAAAVANAQSTGSAVVAPSLASTNPTAVPLASIYASAPVQTTATHPWTYSHPSMIQKMCRNK
ncbi:hypothetical protein BDV93DRAFT_564696 [Ceratobasidium sp. AG-I]|nr:hypothetical protein BDV93DRAFT_566930 [Ceratobasidium sp. AG-I]KAF8595128.1 hypothetical protein BDV93DRAFT_564696 [Ceratobasidium sp. AG-I]